MCNTTEDRVNDGQDRGLPGHNVLVSQAQHHESACQELLITPVVVEPVGTAGMELVTIGLDDEPAVDEEVHFSDALDRDSVLDLVATGGQESAQSRFDEGASTPRASSGLGHSSEVCLSSCSCKLLDVLSSLDNSSDFKDPLGGNTEFTISSNFGNNSEDRAERN